MANTTFSKAHRLNFDAVTANVPADKYGVFVLGELDRLGRFGIRFVGYSFTDLRQALLDRVATAAMFMFRVCDSDEQVFSTACTLFHEFSPMGNLLHPDRPPGSTWRCSRCAMPAAVNA